MNSTGIHARIKGNFALSSAHIQPGRAVKFMSAASAVACAIALSSVAAAQSVPGDCVAPSPLASGSTILCVAAGTITGPVSGAGVEDLTIVIGDANTATTVTSGSTAVILAGAGSQTLTVTNAGSVVTGTRIGAYIGVEAGTGALTVNSQGTISGGSRGIQANNDGTGVTRITVADVNGGLGRGIDVYGNGAVIVDTTAGTVSGGEAGISVENNGTGGISITTADVTATGGFDGESSSSFYGAGIRAQNGVGSTGDIVIDSSAGTVTGYALGIFAGGEGEGGIDITTADVSGGFVGIGTFNGDDGESSSQGGIAIDTTAGTVTGGFLGIYAVNGGAGSINITTADVSTTGGFDGESSVPFNGIGIGARNGELSTGGVAINTAAGSVSGGAAGILVSNYGTGGISITTADVSATAGYYGESSVPFGGIGINVRNGEASTGAAVINTTAGTVSGGQAGISVSNYGAGGISITTADVTATGGFDGESYSPLNGAGIRARNGSGSTGDIAIDSTAGTVTGTGAGIYAVSEGHGEIAITTADVSGDLIGVVAFNRYSGEGDSRAGVTINTVAGTVVGGEAGIIAQNQGAGGISITTADVSATNSAYGESSSPLNSVGIFALNAGESSDGIIIDSSAGTVSGGSTGIFAINLGQGGIAITTADVSGGVVAINTGFYGEGGSLGGIVINSVGTVSGDEIGIQAQATAGDISITAHNVTSVTGPAISATAGGGILARAPAPIAAAGDLVINTTGTVVGGSAGVLLNNFGDGSSTVNNSGVLSATDGPAILAFGAPVTINNSGTLNGFVTLTDGNDRFNNTGRFNAGLGNDFGAGTDVFSNSGTLAVTGQAPVELAGLETFNNTGLVDLRDGQTGTVLALPGDYVGSGNARLAVDVDNGVSGPTADTLVIAGAATGRTGLVVNVLGSAGNELGLENLLLVDAGAGSSATAFTIATGLEEQGFLRLGVKFDEAANSYVLAVGPSLAAHRTSLYAEGMRNLWYKTADSWTRHMASVRNTPVKPGATYWISAVGEYAKRDNNRAITFNDATEIHDLGYNQDYFGTQLGVDLNGGSGFNFGVTGGYLSSTQKFNGSSDRVKYNAINIGAYAGFASGIVFANVLAKYDHVWADTHSVGGRFDETLKGGVYGVRGEVGLTFGDAATGFFAEPAVSLSYIGSDLDTLVTDQGSIDFVEDEGLLGKFGGRVGYAGFTGTSLYIGANLVSEFAGDDRIVLQTAGRTFSIANHAERDYVETMAGVNIGDPSGKATGVFELRYSDGGDHKGFGGSATINFKF